MTSRKKAVEAVYGFSFPDELHAFHDFWQKHGALWSSAFGGIDVVGPFALLRHPKAKLDPGGDWPRFYNDPPEFFTVMTGDTDGLHWGYWFDDPNDREMRPVVASYYSNDSFEMTQHASLFDALREDVELRARDAEGYLESDPEHADDYRERLETAARMREAIAEHARKGKASRKAVAHTRHHMGIVVPRAKYAPLASKDPFETWNYAPKAREVEALVAKARTLASEGKPGAALKLGQDLWGYAKLHAEAAAMLDLAYEALGRKILRGYLERAVAFRRACDAKRK